ncbi:DUF3488 domain-containing transglutaminase family protein [Salinimonas sp. HHU 13199]|uniref:DUF3488 domain-containing transglutaminase family protein n=1 Tax=Salinimonas profundi TaxID=2729140 RepID=A0ABR8LLL0_9ALTE|nr:DUF3488 and transglutaminase-like domain-containing protein [Salinimonas profundi]MBD3584959.1 DUF3488 domain-containing transglutaminase family protein [Salinimonas profundi]
MKGTGLPVKGHRATLILSIAMLVLTVVLNQPLMGWVMLMMTCAAVIRFYLFRAGQTQKLSQRLVNLLAVLACIALAWFSGQQGLLEIMVNLLVTGCALKLLVLRRTKDFLQLTACAFFLTGCALIFEQALSTAIVLSIIVLLLLLGLQQLYAPQLAFKKHLSANVKLGLQALPIASLLFLIMPQLPPLWGMPAGKSTQTGLSESMTPGDIAALTQSTDRVFTATFSQALPPPQQRYWRAMVLESFNGNTWTVSEYRKQQQLLSQFTTRTLEAEPQGNWAEYQLIIEPNASKWLYALDVSRPADRASLTKVISNQDYSLSTVQPVMSKQLFDMQYNADAKKPLAANGIDTQLNLQLPVSGKNPRAKDWAQQLRHRYSDNNALVDAIMRYFADQNFSYTLTPGAMPEHPVDTFLFERQAGFCAHYASAMTYVLRETGIPARIVSGYQGGEAITQNALSVYQYDAHAWVEAAPDGKTWERFDPTAMVAMSRLQYGFQQSMADQHADMPLFSRARARDSALLGGLFAMIDTVNYQWSRWVLGFDNERQQDMLTDILGEKTTTKLALFGLAVMLFITGLLALYFIPKPAARYTDEIQRLYDSLSARLHKLTGVERANLSARQYLHLLAPHLDAQTFSLFEQFTQQYEKIRYVPSGQQRNHYARLRSQHRILMKQLKKGMGGFRPSPLTEE